MQGYALSEVKLAGVVSSGLNPHAMFVDPRGLGYTVRAGERISSAAARVVRITDDSVIVEMPEDLGPGMLPHLLHRRISIPRTELALVDPLSLR